jgi:predicted amidophosphoribosyltransferase
MDQRPLPAGFGNCGRCAFAGTGSVAICHECASKTLERLPPNPCPLCGLALRPDGTCGNPLCNWDEHDRFFRRIYAIAMRTGALRDAIDRYKIAPGRQGWAWIFGRVLVGHLNANRNEFVAYDLIVPSPTYVGPGGRAFDHISRIVERAMIEDDGTWPFRLDVVTKTAPTPPFRGRTWQQRHDIAVGQLRSALAVRDPEIVRGRRVLVFDDVYTEGLTLREVARVLRLAGAIEVSEVVLARQPYGGG